MLLWGVFSEGADVEVYHESVMETVCTGVTTHDMLWMSISLKVEKRIMGSHETKLSKNYDSYT